MLDLLVAVMAQIVRSVLDVVTAVVVPAPVPAASASGAGTPSAPSLPTSAELRAFLQAGGSGTPPADWLARVRAAEGPALSAQIPAATIPAATPLPAPAAAQLPATTPSPAPPASAPPAETIAAASAPPAAAAADTTAPQQPSLVEQERASNPNFGGVPATPRPVEHSWDALPLSPARFGATAPARPAADNTEHAAPATPPAPATTATASAPAFLAPETLLNPNAGTVMASPHPVAHTWESLPLSPARFGDTGPAAQSAAPSHAAATSAAGSSADTAPPVDGTPTWPSLPPWPPSFARRDSAATRVPLRERVRTTWYV